MKKKLLLAVAAVACLAAVIACGSMAYFSASKTVTNKFYVSTYDPENPGPNPPTEEELFGIKVEETEIVNGVPTGNKTTTGNTYKDVAPASEYTKDPTIKGTGAYAAWVRMNVTITKASAWAASYTKAALTTSTDLTPIFKNLDTTKWTKVAAETEVDATNDTITYVFYYADALNKDDVTTPLFDAVVIPAAFEQSDMVEINGFEIKIVADAIQKENTGATSQAAFSSYWTD